MGGRLPAYEKSQVAHKGLTVFNYGKWRFLASQDI